MTVHAEGGKWICAYPLQDSQDEETMRGTDPRLPWPVRRRCDSQRDWAARIMAFAVPNAAAIRAIAQHTKNLTILEVGAGTGYWQQCLSASGMYLTWFWHCGTAVKLQLFFYSVVVFAWKNCALPNVPNTQYLKSVSELDFIHSFGKMSICKLSKAGPTRYIGILMTLYLDSLRMISIN